eukprot:409612_1
MALMASNMKQKKHSYNNRYSYKKDAKKEYENIRKNELKYKTPSVNNNKIHSNFTSLRKSRKIITPINNNNNNNNNNISYINALDINQTPKASNTLKGLPTPSTQTPVKLIKYLNVKTPQTVHNNDNEKCVKRKLSLRFDDNNILQNDKNKTTEIEINSALKRTKKQIDTKSWKDIAYTPRDDNGNKSWKDIDYKCDKNQNKNDSNELSEFDKLILCTRRLQLPLKFLGLLQKFNALESTLALYMRKNNFFVHLGNIERSVQQITKKRFTTNDFQQILHIMPEFYHVQWTAYVNKGAGITKKELRITVTGMDRKYDDLGLNNNDDENITKKKGGKSIDIGLKFLKVSKLRERENIFRLKLYEYIREEHKQYLIDNILIEFDPFISGNWHRNFDLENMKNIAMNLLPRKPIKNRNEMEKMVNDQNEQLEYIMEKEIEIIKKQKENNSLPSHLRGLSPTFIAKIRAKTKNRKIKNDKLNAKNENFDENKYRLKQLPYLVNLIRGIYVSLKKGSMSCNDLISLVKKRHKNKFILNQEVWKQLQMINDLKTKFFIIKQGKIMKIAKLNKKVNVKEVFDKINLQIKQ